MKIKLIKSLKSRSYEKLEKEKINGSKSNQRNECGNRQNNIVWF